MAAVLLSTPARRRDRASFTRALARSPATGLVVAAALSAAPAAAADAADCASLMPSTTAAPMRKLEPEDLVKLRDIGPVDPMQQDNRLFSVSPDGSHAAFQLRRGDPATNGFCLAMMVVDLRSGAKPVVVDRGGDFMRLHLEFRGKYDIPSGFTDPITPRWSPDGQWILYRRQDAGVVQLWRARADGSRSEPITSGSDDVEDFRVLPDGRGVVYAIKPGLRQAWAEIDREGLSGFHYDDRFAPATSSRPFLPTDAASVPLVLDLATSATRPATKDEARLLDAPSMQEGDWTEARAGASRVWVEPAPRSYYQSRGRLKAQVGGPTLTCDASECADATLPWWTGSRVRFVRREGTQSETTAIFEWVPGTAKVRRLYATEDLLLSCVPTADTLTCLREGSLQPRRLEQLDPVTGHRQVAFDPNPEFAHLRLGRVERLRSRNSFGLDSFADMVFPVDYQPGKQYPLVVVQYRSRGFLRGGTGDDYPIQAFANRGFAVISFDRPKALGWDGSADFNGAERIGLKDFADRRSVLEAVEAPVRAAIARGVADPKRIGMTGLSDGSSTAGFAALHSQLFSAFAMSSCCWDTSLAMRVGPSSAREFYAMGYPKITDDSEAARKFWQQIAMSVNAQNVRTPILVQMSDAEYLSALQSYAALKELDRPIDLFVFPGEYHVKYQPAHRLAVYRRSIDWFDYWLNGDRNLGPDRAIDVQRWDQLRGSH